MVQMDNYRNSQARLSSWLIGIGIISIMAFIMITPWLADKYKSEQVAYCHIEQEVMPDSEYDRYLCTNFKIVSRDMDQVNLSRFGDIDPLSFKCYDSIEQLPSCDSNNFYFTSLKLTELCWDCQTRGYVCIEYQYDWQENDTQIIEEFEDYSMLKKYDSKEELRNRFINCTG